jgi:hypothetical protein
MFTDQYPQGEKCDSMIPIRVLRFRKTIRAPQVRILVLHIKSHPCEVGFGQYLTHHATSKRRRHFCDIEQRIFNLLRAKILIGVSITDSCDSLVHTETSL